MGFTQVYAHSRKQALLGRVTECGLSETLFTWQNRGHFWERKISPVRVRVATPKLGPRTRYRAQKKKIVVNTGWKIFFGLLPLNVYKLEGVKEIYFGIPVTKRVLSSFVGTAAMHLRARRNDTQSGDTRAAVRCKTNSTPSRPTVQT